jgi:hypothetical protein
MKAYRNISGPAALAAIVILGVQFVAVDAFAGKRKLVHRAPQAKASSMLHTKYKHHARKPARIACDPCLHGAARKYSPQYGCFLGVTC